jgi:hypothetical protein
VTAVVAKKKILIPWEMFNSPLGIFFQEAGFELETDYTEENKEEIAFIINDYLPEAINLPRIKVDPSRNYSPFIEKNIKGTFDSNFINDLDVQKIIKLFIANETEFDLVDAYSKDSKKVRYFKIQDYLNVGFFIDQLVIDSYKDHFDYDGIRAYLNDLLEFSFREVETPEENTLLEISSASSEDTFVLKISFIKEDFKLKSTDLLTKKLMAQTNCIDFNYFTKRKKVTISSIWFKNPEIKNFRASFLSEIDSKNKSVDFNIQLDNGLVEQEEIIYQPRNRSLEEAQGKKLSQARNLALFIKNIRKEEESPKDLRRLVPSDIDNYLIDYPRPEVILELDEEIRGFVLKLLKVENFFDGITNFVKKAASGDLEPKIHKIQKVFSSKSIEDLNEIIQIRGTNEKILDKENFVKGWVEETNDEVIISGKVDTITANEKWELRKSELSAKIQDEIIKIKSSGSPIRQEDLIRIVSKEVNITNPQVALIVQDIVEEVIGSELIQKNKLEDALGLKMIAERVISPEDLALKETIVELQAEIKKLKETSSNSTEVVSENSSNANANANVNVNANELMNLKKALSKTLEIIKAKDKLFQKQKNEYEQMFDNKDKKIINLELRMAILKEDISKSAEFHGQEQLEMLQVENKNLNARLDLANQKVSIMNDNLEDQESSAIIRKDKELGVLKSNLLVAQVLIEKLKSERLDLHEKISIEKDKFNKLKDEKVILTHASRDPIDNDPSVIALLAEKRILEEKLKAQSLDLKKIEQKLKFATAQLDESNKRKTVPNGAIGKGNETYIKQLESANLRITDASAEIAEKKKEVIKLKMENTLLTTKVYDLEKKLTILEKKAA